jgi:16S rRNA A1518/A1519 N6-dimethyltransferase RsmA/KsgA/DIM1 with predicted DNA glycosylase/AP lyase activity
MLGRANPAALGSGAAPRSRVHIIGNLPFNIATPLLMRWLETIGNASVDSPLLYPAQLTLCFQKEVADVTSAGCWWEVAGCSKFVISFSCWLV